MTITHADFVILRQNKVCHRATWATYNYENANEAGLEVSEHPGCAGEDNLPTIAELRPHAVKAQPLRAVATAQSGELQLRGSAGDLEREEVLPLRP